MIQVAFSPDQSRLAVAGVEESVMLRDLVEDRRGLSEIGLPSGRPPTSA